MYSATRSSKVRELASQLYRDKRPRLIAIAQRNAANGADAEEALQAAFASFIDAFDPEGEAPALAWLILAMKRECWRSYRDRHLDRHLGQEVEPGSGIRGSVIDAIPSGETAMDQRVAERDIARRRFARLKPDERDSLGLLAAGLSYREIAEHRGWTYTKVNRAISEGRAALRRAQCA
jgi:RNA polymerase sigma factor (sigma-70 family)